MNAVGIDVSKGKSMVAALRPMGEVALLPQEFLHTEVGLEQMAYAEGKPYFVYMTAAQNKFLRIYYARVKECLEAFDERQDTVQN